VIKPRLPTQQERREVKSLSAQTPEAAYTLGFLWADGHLPPHCAVVSCEVVASDGEELLPIFSTCGRWRASRRTRPNRREQMCLSVLNLPFRRQLEQWGFQERGKGADQVLAELVQPLHPHWWRGYFDGDGSLYFRGATRQITFAGPYEQDWSFCEDLPVVGQVQRQVTKKGHRYSCYRITQGRKVRAALEFMQFDQPPQVGLSRKQKHATCFLANINKWEVEGRRRLAQGGRRGGIKAKAKNAKLTAGQVDQIRTLRQEGTSYTKISAGFPVSASQVGRVCRGEQW